MFNFSIIVPVYNRPNEIDALLESLVHQNFYDSFEVLIIEDGSTEKSDAIVEKFQSQLKIQYFFKENSGAGSSRNYGMERALGDYFLILDSDVLLPKNYLYEVHKGLTTHFTDAFGGPDAAHDSFTPLQKAINYSMTSVLTTGGIRGKKQVIGKFQPRSFNLGLSKVAYESTQGFSEMKNGEDIDLTFRIWENGYETQLIEKAFVYHKRRSTLTQFFKQTFGFGTARPILNKKYPETAKITYWFPTLFIIGLDLSLLFALFGNFTFLSIYGLYFGFLFIDALIQYQKINVAFFSIVTSLTQFLGYGLGFLSSQFKKK